MADHQTAASPLFEEACIYLNLIPNPEGSFTRPTPYPTVPPNLNPEPTTHFLSKDVPLNPTSGTFLRLFRQPPPAISKLPIIIYFHGGGFVQFSAATTIFHDYCGRMAAHVPALVVSLDYRLTPEHRLPAAYDDAMDAISWVKNQASGESTETDPWVRELGDFSRVYIMGSSAGGNMAYHASVRSLDLHISPMKIAGLILHQPFFGGVQRSESELRLADNAAIPLQRSDCYWYVSLPEGADRDHEYSNVALSAAAGPQKKKIRRLPRCLVKGCSGDLLVDRQKEAAKMLAGNDVDVVAVFSEGGYHAVEIFDQNMAQVLYDDVKDFVNFPTGA